MTAASSFARRALLVGINRYANFGMSAQLQGCVNDVHAMRELLLQKFDFPANLITTLLDEQATRHAIIAAFDDLISRTGEGDVVVFQFSGHGSQQTDGPEHDEEDGLDETLVPHDSGRAPLPNRDITDDELHTRLVRLAEKTPYVTLMIDACHSGTVMRDLDENLLPARVRWIEPDLRPWGELAAGMLGEPISRGARDLDSSGWLPPGRSHTLLASCHSKESSFELAHKGGHYGSFTFYFLKELEEANGDTTYRDVFERAAAQVTYRHPCQHPQLEGAHDRQLFGPLQIPPLRHAVVRARQKKRVLLGAGAACGLTEGSVWAVYPQGTKTTSETEPLGRIEITVVRAVTSEATLLNETRPEAVQPGGRAVEEEHRFGHAGLKVSHHIPSRFRDSQKQLVEEVFGREKSKDQERSLLLSLAGPDNTADIEIWLVPARGEEEVGPGVPLSGLGALEKDSWIVTSPSHDVLMPIHTVDDLEAIGKMADNLERRARFDYVLKLDNPLSQLAKVGFTLLRQVQGRWERTAPGEGGEVVYEEGELFACRFTNLSEVPLYIHLLDCGPAGKIELLYPVEGAYEALLPGESIEIGTRAGDEIAALLPDNYPFVGEGGVGTEGTDILKVLVTSHPANIFYLFQDNFREFLEEQEELGGRSALEGLLWGAFDNRYRDLRRLHRPGRDEDWTALEQSFVIRRVRPLEAASPSWDWFAVG